MAAAEGRLLQTLAAPAPQPCPATPTPLPPCRHTGPLNRLQLHLHRGGAPGAAAGQEGVGRAGHAAAAPPLPAGLQVLHRGGSMRCSSVDPWQRAHLGISMQGAPAWLQVWGRNSVHRALGLWMRCKSMLDSGNVLDADTGPDPGALPQDDQRNHGHEAGGWCGRFHACVRHPSGRSQPCLSFFCPVLSCCLLCRSESVCACIAQPPATTRRPSTL